MMRQLLVTATTAGSLIGLYFAYAALLRPVVDVPLAPPRPAAGVDAEAPRPLENVRIAQEHLSHQKWAASAKYHLRSQQAFVYTNDLQPEGREGRVRLRPFALAWVEVDPDTRTEQVFTVVSESALVKFAGSYEVSNPDPGRVVFAALDGPAQVAGPNGLLIDGRNFFFSESSSNLWSDHAVKFAYAGSLGSADGIEIDLIPQQGPPRKDRPHIFGASAVRLRRNVNMQLQLKQGREPLTLTVRAGGFVYDLIARQAVYTTNVQASRMTGPEQYDWIDCDQLTVEFAGGDSPGTGASSATAEYQQFDRRLEFRRLHAESLPPSDPQRKRKPVLLVSHAHQLEATAEELVYDGQQRWLSLRAADGVKIRQQQGLNQLKAPQVVLQLAEGGRLAGAWCRGPGWLVHRVERSAEVVFAADWRQQLRYQPDPVSGLDVWELGDSATFRQPGEGTALGGDYIRLWATGPTSSPGSAPSHDAAPQSAVLSGSTQVLDPKFVGGLQPRRMEAVGNVVLVSPRLEARCQRLEGWIEPEDAAHAPNSEDAVRPVSGLANHSATSPSNQQPAAEPFQAHAEYIGVRLRKRGQSAPELAEVWTEGRVVLRQPQPAGQPPRTITGTRVHLQNGGSNEQVVQIAGQPAQLRDAGFYLEAQQAIQLDRAENRVWTDSPGALQLLLKEDPRGTPLPKPQPLDVTWKERMAFDGTAATFTGQVTARFGDSQMTCQQLRVVLSEPVSFTDLRQTSGAVQVRSVHCRDDVQFQNFTYDRQQIIEVQRAQVWELYLDRATGLAQAQGPGEMRMWRRGQAPRAGLGPQQSAKANRPVELEPADWEYTFVKFNGRMEGNLERRYANFYERVEIVHGPVPTAQAAINRDALPRGGGWMRCDELQVMQLPAADRSRGYIQVVGQGNVDLEGREFFAKADQVVYDEAKGAYTLRGFGRTARLWHEKQPGRTSPTELQGMVYNPETRELRAVVVGGEGSSR
jgi:lipopolysaccharide export system protein LptA